MVGKCTKTVYFCVRLNVANLLLSSGLPAAQVQGFSQGDDPGCELLMLLANLIRSFQIGPAGCMASVTMSESVIIRRKCSLCLRAMSSPTGVEERMEEFI